MSLLGTTPLGLDGTLMVILFDDGDCAVSLGTPHTSVSITFTPDAALWLAETLKRAADANTDPTPR